VEFLVELTARYERQVTSLEARIERLAEKLRESSQNSSRPPSADPPGKRPQAKGSPSGRKQGGQPGHEGKTRKLVADRLDEIVDHWPERCSGCGQDLDPGELERWLAGFYEGADLFEQVLGLPLKLYPSRKYRNWRLCESGSAGLRRGGPRRAHVRRLWRGRRCR
jgi:hypothetical protein